MNGAQIATVLTAAAALIGAAAGLVKAVQAGRKVDAHTAQGPAAAHPADYKPQAAEGNDSFGPPESSVIVAPLPPPPPPPEVVQEAIVPLEGGKRRPAP